MEEAAAQERVGQLLLVIRGDHHDRALGRAHGFFRLVDVEFHAIELLKEIVREFDVGLVDLVDQQDGKLGGSERLPQLALADIVRDVVDSLVAELTVAQARHRIIFVQALLRLGGGFHVPLDKRRASRLGNFISEYGFAGAGLTLYQQRPPQHNGGVDRDLQIIGRDIALRAFETLHALFPSRSNIGFGMIEIGRRCKRLGRILLLKSGTRLRASGKQAPQAVVLQGQLLRAKGERPRAGRISCDFLRRSKDRGAGWELRGCDGDVRARCRCRQNRTNGMPIEEQCQCGATGAAHARRLGQGGERMTLRRNGSFGLCMARRGGDRSDGGSHCGEHRPLRIEGRCHALKRTVAIRRGGKRYQAWCRAMKVAKRMNRVCKITGAGGRQAQSHRMITGERAFLIDDQINGIALCRC